MEDHDDLRKRVVKTVEDLENGSDSSDSEREIDLTTRKTTFMCIPGITGGYLGKLILLSGKFEKHFPPSLFLVGPNKYLTSLAMFLIVLFNIFFEMLLVYKYQIRNSRFLGKCSRKGLMVMPITCVMTLLIYLRVYFSNPGYIPKAQSEETSMKLYPNKRLHECCVCYAYIPTGTFHCEYCDVCCEDLDHHCPWVGKCIGKYNQCSFFCLVAFLIFNAVIVLWPLFFMCM